MPSWAAAQCLIRSASPSRLAAPPASSSTTSRLCPAIFVSSNMHQPASTM